MTPSDPAAAIPSQSGRSKPPPDSIAAADAARTRRLRRFEVVCWAGVVVFSGAWACSLFFQIQYRATTSSIDLYDSVLRMRWWNQPVEGEPGPIIRAGWIDRAGDLPWLERLGLTLPAIDHRLQYGRIDAQLLELPMWLVVGFYAALAARLRRRRLHPDWQPRGSPAAAVAWTLVTLAFAILAIFAAMGDLTTRGQRHYAAARMNRFAFVWSENNPEQKHRIPESHSRMTLFERCAIEPPVFVPTTEWRRQPELVVCVPSWMLLLPCLYLTVVAWRRVKPIAPNLCKRCRYDLTGNTSGKCSECGRVIDWDIHGTRQ